jgi:hypothetical protein
MRMAGVGCWPAYNGQLAMDNSGQVMLGRDMAQRTPMVEGVKEGYGQRATAWLVDGS